ncbi:MAG TPA: hypothetical protein QGH10_07350, partial [Armatimonadota bacterium]|nr:hypothetical protein [Armatimonadota bacterium]
RLVPQPDASALDHESGRSFAVDLALSRMHDDICEARELSIQRRLNDLCDGLKEVVDVPVIAKRHHEATRVWSNQDDSGGLDGLGMESYAGGDRLGTFNGAATYAEVVQAKRPMWCLVTEYNGVTWTDRHITYQTREEMCSDLNLLLGMGARGVFMFGLSLAGSDGDKNWTIFELINDPRQLEWLATFGRAARADLNWLTRQPDVAFAYPPQNSDARAFAQTEDYGLSGSWAGERSILKLGPGRWLAPVYTPDVPGPILHSPLIDGEPRFARERAAVRGKRHYATDLADPLSLPGGLAKRFAQTPRPSVDIGISTPVPGVEAVEWRDAKGTPHITLRAIGEAASITISANRANARATALGLPHTIALAAAQLAPRQFIIANPSFIKEPATFECPVGDSPAPFELAGIALADILITVD